MRKLIVIFSLIIVLPLAAQEVRTARVIKKADAAEKPEPTPAPRRSIIDRFFTKEKATPTPTPKPVVAAKKVTPKPVKPVVAKPTKPKGKPVAETEETETEKKPAPTETPAPAEQPPTTAETPATVPPAPAEKPAEEPKATGKTAKGKAGAKPVKIDTSNLDEAGKYKAAKEAALKEQSIIDLKGKAESIIDAADAKQATLNYNRALFKKIRELEPSIDAYVDRLEQAVLKRVK